MQFFKNNARIICFWGHKKSYRLRTISKNSSNLRINFFEIHLKSSRHIIRHCFSFFECKMKLQKIVHLQKQTGKIIKYICFGCVLILYLRFEHLLQYFDSILKHLLSWVFLILLSSNFEKLKIIIIYRIHLKFINIKGKNKLLHHYYIQKASTTSKFYI